MVGLILPAIDYAAPLIAFGCVIAQSEKMLEDSWRKKRFEYLWSLEDGSGCLYFESGHCFNGIIVEHQNNNGAEKRLKVQYTGKSSKSTGTVVYATPQLAHLFQPSRKVGHIAANPKPQKVHVSAIFEEMHRSFGIPLERVSDMACLVIGPLDRYQLELSHPVRIETAGRLGDLILPLSHVANREIYRSEVWFQQHEDDPPLITPETPVIFNGSRAFVESESEWRYHDIFVILSPIDPKFEDALNQVEQLYERKREAPQRAFLNSLPHFMEVTFFSQRAVRD